MLANRLIKYLFLFLVLIPPLVFFTDLTQNPYYIQGIILNTLILLIWGIWVIKSLKEGKIVLIRTCLDVPFWSFLFICVISFVYSITIHSQMREAIYRWGLKNILFLITNALLVFYSVVYFLREEKFFKKVIYLIFLLMFFICVYGILQYLGIEIIWPHTLNPFGGRCISTFGNPNFLSSFIVLILPLIFGFFIWVNSNFIKFLFLSLFLIGFIALLFTFCRSSWFGFLVSLICMLGLWIIIDKKIILKNKNWLIASSIFIVLIILFSPRSAVVEDGTNVVERACAAFNAEKSNQAIYQRLLIWETALSILKKYPYLGCGWGCFELFYPFYQGRFLRLDYFRPFRTHANNVHNEVLEVLTQVGIIGLIVFCWLFFNLGKYCYHSVKRLVHTKGEICEKVLIPSLIGSVVGMLVDNMLNVSLHFPIPAFFFWLNVGFLINMGKKIEKENSYVLIDLERNKYNFFLKSSFYLLGWIILTLIVGIIWMEARNFVSAIYFFKGYKLSRNTTQNTNILKKSIIEYTKAYELNRFSVHNNYQLGNVLARVGNIEEAIQFYKKALRAHPGYDEIYFNLGVMYSKIKLWDKAIENYKTSLIINPFNINIYVNLGHVYIEKEMLDEGLEIYNKALEIDPCNKEIYNNLGYIYSKMKKWEKAKNCYRKALQIDPNFYAAKENILSLQKIFKKGNLKEKPNSP